MSIRAETLARRARLGMGPPPAFVPPKREPVRQAVGSWFPFSMVAAWRFKIPVTAQLGELPPPRHLGDIRKIQHVVCMKFGISHIDIISARRTARVVEPRQIAMYLCRTQTTRSLPEIGRMFGWRDHTTVLHAVNKIAQRRVDDPHTADLIEEFKAKLR